MTKLYAKFLSFVLFVLGLFGKALGQFGNNYGKNEPIHPGFLVPVSRRESILSPSTFSNTLFFLSSVIILIKIIRNKFLKKIEIRLHYLFFSMIGLLLSALDRFMKNLRTYLPSSEGESIGPNIYDKTPFIPIIMLSINILFLIFFFGVVIRDIRQERKLAKEQTIEIKDNTPPTPQL